jgi:hypothetical protein
VVDVDVVDAEIIDTRMMPNEQKLSHRRLVMSSNLNLMKQKESDNGGWLRRRVRRMAEILQSIFRPSPRVQPTKQHVKPETKQTHHSLSGDSLTANEPMKYLQPLESKRRHRKSELSGAWSEDTQKTSDDAPR